jgi:hypothetical protein
MLLFPDRPTAPDQHALGLLPDLTGWKPISVNLIKGLSGWMYFVPEGQHDSSQVRSAWVAIQKDPVPERV